MKLSDDLRSPQGMVEGTASSFANSWKAKTTCADSPDRLDDPCSISVDNGEALPILWDYSPLRQVDHFFKKKLDFQTLLNIVKLNTS